MDIWLFAKIITENIVLLLRVFFSIPHSINWFSGYDFQSEDFTVEIYCKLIMEQNIVNYCFISVKKDKHLYKNEFSLQ